jgi:membrane protein YfhO
VWENPRAMPLFFMPRRLTRRSGDAAVAEALANPDFGEVATTEAADADADADATGDAAQQGTVEAIRPRSNGFDLVLRSTTGGTVASSVSYAPGWSASYGGENHPTFVVDGGFLGFEVPAGVHRVRLDFAPWSWVWGRRLALLGAVVALALLAGAGVSTRQRAGAPASS